MREASCNTDESNHPTNFELGILAVDKIIDQSFDYPIRFFPSDTPLFVLEKFDDLLNLFRTLLLHLRLTVRQRFAHIWAQHGDRLFPEFHTCSTHFVILSIETLRTRVEATTRITPYTSIKLLACTLVGACAHTTLLYGRVCECGRVCLGRA